MKSIIFVTPVDEESIDKFLWTKHTIVYFDDETDQMKIAIPDYHNQFVDDNHLDEAMNSRWIAVYENVSKTKLYRSHTPVIMLTLEDDVIEQVNYKGHAINLFANRIDTKKLLKKLN